MDDSKQSWQLWTGVLKGLSVSIYACEHTLGHRYVNQKKKIAKCGATTYLSQKDLLDFHTGADLDPVAHSQSSVLLTKDQTKTEGVCGKRLGGRSETIPQKNQGEDHCTYEKVKAPR